MSTPRGRPSFAYTQKRTILDLLLKAGSHGVSKQSLVFDLHITQASARVHSLEHRGYKIRHEMRPGETYVTFILESVPEHEIPLPTYEKKGVDARQKSLNGDWFEHATGKPRPTEPTPNAGPLFRQDGAN